MKIRLFTALSCIVGLVWLVLSGTQPMAAQSPYPLVEEFDSAAGFTSTDPANVYVDEANSRAVLNVTRSTTRLLWRTVPDLSSGDFRLIVKGQFNNANNNCAVGVYLTEGLPAFNEFHPGTTIYFGFFGGGCPNSFYHINASWGYPNMQGYNTHQGYECGGSNGTIIPISLGVPYTAELEILSSQGTGTLSIFDAAGNLVGSLTGPAGFQADFGTLNVLSLGLVAGNDWPSCSGYVDSVRIEPIFSPLPAIVDIDPDTLNLKDKGKWITAYIEVPDGYDVADINVGTVTLEGTIPAEAHPTEVGDYDDDGITDLMVKFDRSALIEYLDATTGEVTLTVSGELNDGTPFEGSDTITVIDQGK